MPSFEETYKTAYSHGLEAIYALENVDLKSIRPMQSTKIEAPVSHPVVRPPVRLKEIFSPQLEIDFGPGFRLWMPPFIIHEPIQVLELAKHVENRLLEHGKKQIGDLIGLELKELACFKGLGHGHLNEIQLKFHKYLSSKDLEKSFSIDCASWIRCLVANSTRKKLYLYLHKFGLEHTTPLLPSEMMEIKRLTVTKKEEWEKEAFEELRTGNRLQLVKQGTQQIVEAFIKPWMRCRLGMAHREEMMERVLRVSDDPFLMKKMIDFIGQTYFSGSFPLGDYLIQSEENIFCSDRQNDQIFQKIVKGTFTYFYRPQIRYELYSLVNWVYRELAKNWVDVSGEVILKVLRLSSKFFILKNEKGQLMIQI
jgi:hypothetical protein